MKIKRYFTPDVNKWKYVDDDGSKESDAKVIKEKMRMSQIYGTDEEITDKEKNIAIRNSFKLMTWNVSFTKNVVQLAFILFLLGNIFIAVMISINFWTVGNLEFFDTYISEMFDMFKNVIGAYILKSTAENVGKIGFSVLSDYIDTKYKGKLQDPSDNKGNSNNTVIFNSNNPSPNEDSYEESIVAELEAADIGEYNEEEDPLKNGRITEEV